MIKCEACQFDRVQRRVTNMLSELKAGTFYLISSEARRVRDICLRYLRLAYKRAWKEFLQDVDVVELRAQADASMPDCPHLTITLFHTIYF